MRVLSLSFVALAVSAAVVQDALALSTPIKNNLEIVHGAQPKDYSANYVSVFARDEDPDVEFELIDIPAKSIRGKIVSLKRRGIAGCEEEYTAKHGDTCLKVTDKFGIHLDDFLFWNPQVNENCKNLKAGKKYCVKHSTAGSPDSCTKRHKVVSGDTCKKVAKQYGISLSKFYEMNEPINEGSCNNLKIGRSYCVSMESKTKEKTSVKVQKVKGKEDEKESKKQESKEKEEKEATEKKQEEKDDKLKESITNLASKISIDVDDDKKQQGKKESDSSKSSEKEEEEDKKETSSSSEDKKEATKTDDGWIKEESPAPKPEEKEEEKEEEEKQPPKKEQRKMINSNVDMTYYWIAQPQDYTKGGKTVSIKTCSGKTIGKTNQEYADALVMEGTGLLGDKIVNLGACSCSGGYSCFMEIDKKEDPFGLTSYGSPLRPFVTAAANDIPRGTKVYVPQLDGWELPGTSKKHNGCLLVDDQGWSFSSNHLDFYVYSMDNYHSLNNEHSVSSVDIYEGGSCKLIDYM